jgi:hypothetical protein
MSARRWREPVLGLLGVALAVLCAGVGVAVANRIQENDQRYHVYSLQSHGIEQPAATVTPTFEAAAPASVTVAAVTETAAAAKPVTPTPASPIPAPPTLERSTFALPADATANNGATIGPFCCRGRTVTVRTASGDVAAYVYWFKWAGQAYDIPRNGAFEGAYPDIRVLVAVPGSGEAVISFSASEAVPGAEKSLELGNLGFVVRLESAEQTTYAGQLFTWETSLSARLRVEAR